MVQAEWASAWRPLPGRRCTAHPASRPPGTARGVLAGTVSRQVFWPVPNVDSVLVGFDRDAEPRGTEEHRLRTFQIVDAAFQQRRKMLRQALSGVLGGTAAEASARLEAAGVDPTLRGEQLTVDDYARIAGAS